jgi:hypothetical protein
VTRSHHAAAVASALTDGYDRAFLIGGILLAVGTLLATALPSAAKQRQVQEVASAPAPIEPAESPVDAS